MIIFCYLICFIIFKWKSSWSLSYSERHIFNSSPSSSSSSSCLWTPRGIQFSTIIKLSFNCWVKNNKPEATFLFNLKLSMTLGFHSFTWLPVSPLSHTFVSHTKWWAPLLSQDSIFTLGLLNPKNKSSPYILPWSMFFVWLVNLSKCLWVESQTVSKKLEKKRKKRKEVKTYRTSRVVVDTWT